MSKIELVKNKYQSVTNTVNGVQNALSMYRDMKVRYNEKFLYTASIEENSYIYHDLMQYIDSRTSSRKFKFRADRDGVWRYYDSKATVDVDVEGHTLKAEVVKPKSDRAEEDGNEIFLMSGNDELVFTSRTMEGIDALERLMDKFRKERQVGGKRALYLAQVDGWGEWDFDTLPAKTMDSVILPDGIKEDLVADIEKFRAREDRFKTLDLPWHRGYAFYGVPGNGKSSIALALANYFKMDMYNMSLSTLKEDKNFNKAISRIKKNSILLLEDVDIYSASMTREQSAAGHTTLASLLNALDGVSTPHGLITIMTTNHIDTLDPALIRPGRMDYKLELKPPVQSQVDQMFRRIFDSELNQEAKEFTSMAEVVDVFKRNLDDEEAARMELKKSE